MKETNESLKSKNKYLLLHKLDHMLIQIIMTTWRHLRLKYSICI